MSKKKNFTYASIGRIRALLTPAASREIGHDKRVLNALRDRLAEARESGTLGDHLTDAGYVGIELVREAKENLPPSKQEILASVPDRLHFELNRKRGEVQARHSSSDTDIVVVADRDSEYKPGDGEEWGVSPTKVLFVNEDGTFALVAAILTPDRVESVSDLLERKLGKPENGSKEPKPMSSADRVAAFRKKYCRKTSGQSSATNGVGGRKNIISRRAAKSDPTIDWVASRKALDVGASVTGLVVPGTKKRSASAPRT